MTYGGSHSRARTGPCGRRGWGFFASRCAESVSLLVAPLRGMDIFECQWFFVEDGLLAGTGIFPCGCIRIVVVVPEGLAVGRLKFLPEMSTARFIALKRIKTHQFAEFQEIRDASGIFELLIQFFPASEHIDVLPELFAKFGNTFQRFFQAGFRARHAAVIPQ